MYAFRLEALRKCRQNQEEILQKEFSQYKLAMSHEKLKLESLQQSKEALLEQFYQMQTKDFNASSSIMFIEYFESLDRYIKAQEKVLSEVRRQHDSKRLELIEASKKMRIIDKLKEYDVSAYRKGLAQHEQKNMDETGIAIFNRSDSFKGLS